MYNNSLFLGKFFNEINVLLTCVWGCISFMDCFKTHTRTCILLQHSPAAYIGTERQQCTCSCSETWMAPNHSVRCIMEMTNMYAGRMWLFQLHCWSKGHKSAKNQLTKTKSVLIIVKQCTKYQMYMYMYISRHVKNLQK